MEQQLFTDDEALVDNMHAEVLIAKVVDKGIDVNAKLAEAFTYAECTRDNIFLTGKAGTGKSVFIKNFVRYTKNKKVVVLAPTGVAAVNVKGQTIHSFFKFPIGLLHGVNAPSCLYDMWNNFDTLIIDEISMVRIDVMVAIDACMRQVGDELQPFGGKQVIAVGDLYQIPPVVQNNEAEVLQKLFPTKWWFDAPNIGTFHVVDLNKVYRQPDPVFVATLDNVRCGNHSLRDISLLNTRVSSVAPSSAISIVLTNALAEAINQRHLSKIKAKEHILMGETTGRFSDSSLPAPQKLVLKVGAKVMLLRNILSENLYNGSIVKVLAIDDSAETITVLNEKTKKQCDISREMWENYAYTVSGGVLKKDVIGTYTQYPLKLAYAITAHKAQGATFDEVIVDFGRGVFEDGQAYVALSRVKTLQGLHLVKAVKYSDIRVDRHVKRFFARY